MLYVKQLKSFFKKIQKNGKKEGMQKFKDKIIKITNNPDIIEGIHNYCDR